MSTPPPAKSTSSSGQTNRTRVIVLLAVFLVLGAIAVVVFVSRSGPPKVSEAEQAAYAEAEAAQERAKVVAPGYGEQPPAPEEPGNVAKSAP